MLPSHVYALNIDVWVLAAGHAEVGAMSHAPLEHPLVASAGKLRFPHHGASSRLTVAGLQCLRWKDDVL